MGRDPHSPTPIHGRRRGSTSSHEDCDDDGSHPGSTNGPQSGHDNAILDEPVLVYHESARSIVFRDHLRRAVKHNNTQQQQQQQHSNGSEQQRVVEPDVHLQSHTEALEAFVTESSSNDSAPIPLAAATTSTVTIPGFTPKIVPLAPLALGPTDDFPELLESEWTPDDDNHIEHHNSNHDNHHHCTFTDAERAVCHMLAHQQCTVKTIKNVDWTAFLTRFHTPYLAHPHRSHCPRAHDDRPPVHDDQDGATTAAAATSVRRDWNSFVTSTSLLPRNGLKMRCFGSTSQYTTGVVFALPSAYADASAEDEAAARTETWSWPAGYSAKTEFNIDGRGRLINGRQEALRPLSVLRQYNDSYLKDTEYMVANRMVSGLSQIPYNEIFLRVGGLGRLLNDTDVSTHEYRTRSFDHGVGLPVALFVRTATYGDLISLLRTRARLVHVWGESHVKGIPLLYVSPDHGVRVLTEALQQVLWKRAAQSLTPFQNATIAYRTTLQHTDAPSFQQKVDELIDFDDDIRDVLTPNELARLAGGFGATDESIATVLQQAMLQDRKVNRQQRAATEEDSSVPEASHQLQDVVNEGLAASVRSGDYHTSRQLLMLYSLVASQADLSDDDDSEDVDSSLETGTDEAKSPRSQNADDGLDRQHSSLRMGEQDVDFIRKDLDLVRHKKDGTLMTNLPLPPPPPPLDTDRLRSATNCDGLLAVLGAAQVLKAMQTGDAKKRAQEAVAAVNEWVDHGEQSVAFRISSWYDQRAAQGDLKIATENDTKFMAFVSNKAISNRKAFARQMRDAVSNTDFGNVRFLQAIDEILGNMHSPCLRLELLQYVLGLDNRYSVAHVIRSVELAASCLGLTSTSQ